MASGTLYSYPNNFRTYKVLIAAQYGGGTVTLAPYVGQGELNKTNDFLKKFPFGKVPAFESTDGVCLSESNAVAYYVASKDLRGERSDRHKAEVFQWLSFSESELLPVVCTWAFPYMGIIQYKERDVTGAKGEALKLLDTLNTYLLTRTYLVGEAITLADIAVACTLLPLYQHVLDPAKRNSIKNVNRWFFTILNQHNVKKVLGEIKLCTEDPKAPSLGKEGKGESAQAKESKKKEKKEKKKSEGEAAAPGEGEASAPQGEAAAPQEGDLTEEILAAEPKSKDPLGDLPKGTFVMDDFKRCYSNEKEEVAIKFLWDKFDKENYSIWFGEYKYNDELTRVFMSCNLITGMFQRLDKMRKNAFGSVCLFGKDNDSSISGVWIWRGQELAFPLSPDWEVDYELYDWTKLDPSNTEHKKLINDYLAWTCTDKKNRPFNQGKIFK